MMSFIHGIELSWRFFLELVKPVLEIDFPTLRYDAGLLGPGSEVLGYDTAQSTDHDWGPRVMLFVREEDFGRIAEELHDHFNSCLPHRFMGYSTGLEPVPDEPGVFRCEAQAAGPVKHRIVVSTVCRFVQEYLDYRWEPGGRIAPDDWLTFGEQKLRSITSGAVYHAGLGDLTALRADLQYYPRDVWLYVLSAAWARIAQEESFVGRCGDVGDELGSRVIAARLVRDIMRLGFLMEQEYAPYAKWFGSAFARLRCGSVLAPIFQRVLSAEDWQAREAAFNEAYRTVAKMHNALQITDPLPTEFSPFHERPYLVIHAGDYADAIYGKIEDPAVKSLLRNLGALDQWSDSTEAVSNEKLRQRLKLVYNETGR